MIWTSRVDGAMAMSQSPEHGLMVSIAPVQLPPSIFSTIINSLSIDHDSKWYPVSICLRMFTLHQDIITIWISYLVGGFNPSEKYESQLGWWHSQYMEKYNWCSSHHQAVIIPLYPIIFHYIPSKIPVYPIKSPFNHHQITIDYPYRLSIDYP